MGDPLDSRRLETFRMVAITGRISEAARRLNLSQPAVTAQVRQLEEAAGRPLLTRHPHGVQLTEAGRGLLEVAQRVHRLLEEAASRLAAPERPAGPL
ncbi:MAG TPA: LysR family transcriptional regulator, partial [Holophagaceae bacterium]|nr:LysR family transcriptional regulator [Holophagaceae bacterium]